MKTLGQTGRAGLQFCGALQRYSSTVLQDRAREQFYSGALGDFRDEPMGDHPPEQLDDMVQRAADAANSIPEFRFNRLYQRMVAEAVYDRGIPAAEEKRSEAGPVFPSTNPPADKIGTLHLNPELEMPEFYDGVEWHLMPGGWDGYDLSLLMFMSGVSPYIFKQGGYAAVEIDADIFGQRTAVLDQLSKGPYERIYEAGCGGTPTLGMLRKKFPEAELVGSDLSAAMLKGGHEADKAFGFDVTLKQEDSRHTSEPDDHYDAAVCYAVFHETPDDVCYDILKEMHRILKPGGELLISDPGPIRALDPYLAVLYDWEQDNREEPHFGASIRRNLVTMMQDIGYQNARDYAVGDGSYPWVTIGEKGS